VAWADDDMDIVAAMAGRCGIALKQAEATRAICRGLKPRRYQLDQYGIQPDKA
jgi:3-hydroxyisobutyrate dehydrogenase